MFGKHVQQHRREFLETVSKSALVAALPGSIAWSTSVASGSITSSESESPRILSLRLLTAAPLARMKEFYHGVLGLPVLREETDQITIGGGETPITFITAKPSQGRPFYHFAFNIPENKISTAGDWQRKRTPLLPLFPSLRDPSFADDVVHLKHWNAHSIYFWDPAGNIVEYIARHDLHNSAKGTFSTKDILHASEIAFVVDDVAAAATQMCQAFDLVQYRKGYENFQAIGDETGLLLVMKRGRNMSSGSNRAQPAEIFPTEADIHGARAMDFSIPDLPYKIAMR